MDKPERASAAFLTKHYRDQRRAIETWTIFHNAGRVEVFDTQTWRDIAHLPADAITQAQAALADCGLLSADDLSSAGYHDTATLTWAWELPDGQAGALVNHAYPAAKHPAMTCLEARLDALLERYALPDDDEA